jgi:DNA (cytosine-5)-methyltransferase 1
MENVPSIKSFKLKNVLGDFVALLEQEGYSVSVDIVYCPQYGIPQTRRRLVLLASLLGPIKLIEPLIKDEKEYRTVRDTIGNLPPIAAGEVCKTDSFHRASRLSPKNLLRIQATSEGGSWKEWPDALKLECHKKKSGRSFGSVYGRMVWNMPSPTITTQCMGLGNGRFGHPSQNRAITPREAALLQTFPLSYKFFEDEKAISIIKASRYVGNAVPPVLGEVIAESILHHLENR